MPIWVSSMDFAIGERLTAAKMDQVLNNVQVLYDWIGFGYSPANAHNHNGTNSAKVAALDATLVHSAVVTLSGSSPAEYTVTLIGSGNNTRYLFDYAVVVSANTGAALYTLPRVRFANYGAAELVVDTSSLNPGGGTSFQIAAWRRSVP